MRAIFGKRGALSTAAGGTGLTRSNAQIGLAQPEILTRPGGNRVRGNAVVWPGNAE